MLDTTGGSYFNWASLENADPFMLGLMDVTDFILKLCDWQHNPNP